MLIICLTEARSCLALSRPHDDPVEIGGSVALCAIGSELPAVDVIAPMAGHASAAEIPGLSRATMTT